MRTRSTFFMHDNNIKFKHNPTNQQKMKWQSFVPTSRVDLSFYTPINQYKITLGGTQPTYRLFPWAHLTIIDYQKLPQLSYMNFLLYIFRVHHTK